MSKSDRALLAFTVSPFVPAAIYWLFGWPRGPHLHFHFWEWAGVVFWTSLVFTLPLTLLVGIPAYVFLERRAMLRPGQVLAVSGVVGAAVGLLAAAPHVGALLGLSAGLTFCLIWYRDRDVRRPF